MFRSGFTATGRWSGAGFLIRRPGSTTHRAEADALPQWNRTYDVALAGERSVTVPLKGSGDHEFMALRGDRLQFVSGADEVTVRILDPAAAAGKQYAACIRSGSVYTEIRLRLTL